MASNNDEFQRIFPKRESNHLARLGILSAVSEATGVKEALQVHIFERAFELLKEYGNVDRTLHESAELSRELYDLIVAMSQGARQSSGFGRIHVEGFQASTTTSPTTVFTVPNGFTLYVTGINLACDNAGGAFAELHIRDGSTSKLPYLLRKADTVNITHTFPEPKRFLRDFNLNIVSGALTMAVSFTGYLELAA